MRCLFLFLLYPLCPLASSGSLSLQAEQLAAAVFADPVAAGQLLMQPGLLSEALQLDAAGAGETPEAHRDRISKSMCAFIEAKEADGVPRVINELPLRDLVKVCEPGAASMTIFTGPTSVGKSLMLEKAAARVKAHKCRMFIVDGRATHTELVRGLGRAIAAEDMGLLEAILVKMLPFEAAQVMDMIRGARRRGSAGAASDAASERSLSEEACLQLLVSHLQAECERRGEFPTIAIDAAELVFCDRADDPKARSRALAALQLFTPSWRRQSSLILASADEYQLDVHLRRLGFNTHHISDAIVAGEAPPAAMKRLLTETWGCGPNLTAALLALYGGHVYRAFQAVRELKCDAELPCDGPGIEGVRALGYGALSAPDHCLHDHTFDKVGVPQDRAQRNALRMRVTEALQALVVDGYYPLKSEESDVAAVFSRTRVGFVAPAHAAASLAPRKAAGSGHTILLLPASHATRLLIAEKTFPRRMHAVAEK